MTDPLKGQHVVVMGFARQGQALARWLPTIGARVTVTDMRSEAAFGDSLAAYRAAGVAFVLGEHPLTLLDDADLLCVSGGVPLTAPLVKAAFERRISVSNDAELFLARCSAPVIGITGSAGKTTTTSLVGAMCRADGRVTHVGGNIGHVLIEALPDIQPKDAVVMELSSFQLELVTHRFLDIEIEYLGGILYDDKISKGIKRQKLISELYPGAKASRCFVDLAKKIAGSTPASRPKGDTNFFWHHLMHGRGA